MMSKSMMNKIMIQMTKTAAIVTVKTVNRIMRNMTIPTKTFQTTTHHTILMVTAITSTSTAPINSRNWNNPMY